MGIDTQDIQSKFFQTLTKRAEMNFFSYVDHIAQNLAYLCLSAEEEGIPFQLTKYQTLEEFISEHKGMATDDLRVILQMSASVEQFFNEATHSWLVVEVKETIAELIETNWQELYRWINENNELIEGNLLKAFKEDPILFTFEVLEHDEIHHIVHEELTEQLLNEVFPMNFLFLYKKGERLYANR
jgi:succinate dehydrogenase flavin-adding protein (antitoxin of CptAB toxin-antitoxin module)